MNQLAFFDTCENVCVGPAFYRGVCFGGYGIVNPITRTELWDWEGIRDSVYQKKFASERKFFLRNAITSEMQFA